jgi:hypothetical protein
MFGNFTQNGLRILKAKPFWFFFSFFLLGFILFRHSFFGFILEYSLSKKYPDIKINFSKIGFKEASMQFEDFELSTPYLELETKEILIGLKLDILHFQIAPQIKVIHPCIFSKEPFVLNGLNAKSSSSNTDYLFKLLNHRIYIEIEDGFWNHADKNRCNFSLKSQADHPEIKKIQLRFLENLSVDSKAEITYRPLHHEFFIHSSMEEFDLHWLQDFGLLKNLPSLPNVDRLEGKISGQMNLRFNRKFQLLKSDLQLALENFKLETAELESIEFEKSLIRLQLQDNLLLGKTKEKNFIYAGSCSFNRFLLKIDHYTAISGSGKIGLNLPIGNEVDIKGQIKVGKDEANFVLLGQSELNELKNKNFVIDFLFTDENLKDSKAHFSFSNQKENDWSIRAKVDQIPSDYLSALQKTLDYYFPQIQNVSLRQGFFSMEANMLFHDYYLKALEIEKVDLQNMQIAFNQPNVVFNVEKVEAGMDYDLKEKKLKKWFVNAYALDCLYEDPIRGKIPFQEGVIKLQQELDCFSFSTVKGRLFNEPMQLEFFGLKNQPNFTLTCTIPSNEVASKLLLKPSSTSYKHEVFVQNIREEDHWKILSTIKDDSGSDVSIQGNLKNYNLATLLTPQGVEEALLGTENILIQGKNVHEGIYGILLKSLRLPWDLEGKIQVDGKFHQGVIDAYLSFDQLAFLSDEIYFQQDRKGDLQAMTKAFLHFDCLSEKLYLTVPLDHGICLHKESNLWFEDVIGNLEIIDTHLKVDHLSLSAENLKMKGQLHLEFLEENPFKLEIQVADVQGKMVNLQRLARHFPEFQDLNFPFDGDLIPLEDPFTLQMILYPQPLLPDWELRTKVVHGEFYDLSLIGIRDVEFDLIIDSKNPYMQIRDLLAFTEINAKKLPYQVSSPLIKLQMIDGIKAEFSIKLETGFLEIANLEGTLEMKGEDLQFNLKPNQFVKEWIPFEKKHDQWIKGGVVFYLGNSQLVNLFHRMMNLSPVSSFILSPLAEEIQHIEGLELAIQVTENNELKCQFFTTASQGKELIHIETVMKGNALEVKKADIKDFHTQCALNLSEREVQLNRMKFSFQNYEMEVENGCFDLVDRTGKISIPHLHIVSIKELMTYLPFLDSSLDGKATVKGDLVFDRDKIQFVVEDLKVLDCPQFVGLEMMNPFVVDLSTDRFVEVSNIHFRLKGEVEHHDYFLVQANTIRFDPNGLQLESDSIKLTIAPELVKNIPSFLSHDLAIRLQEKVEDMKHWDNLVQVDVKLKINPENLSLSGRVENGYYWVKDQAYLFEDVHIELQNYDLDLKGLVRFAEYKVGFQTNLDLKERSTIVLKLENIGYPEEKAKAIFTIKDQELELINLYGRFFGISFDLLPQKLPCSKHESIFTVGLEFDLDEVEPFIPKNLLDVIKNFRIHEKITVNGNLLVDFSDIKNSYFKGFITSKNLQLQEIVIQNVQALVTYDHLSLKIEDFSLADSAILAKFDQFVLHFEKEQFMNFTLKNFQVNDFRPSLITKVDQPKTKIKPFLVRNMKFEELKGNLIRTEEIKGKGYLQFINTFKRENHLIDIPIEIIARLGLDIGLLIPVRGEVDLEVKDQKIVLKELKNSFSDGRRSHFYFPSGSSCFVDFNGQIHIDVKMKQYVLFKITQPFTLSVRGSIDNPSFSLK